MSARIGYGKVSIGFVHYRGLQILILILLGGCAVPEPIADAGEHQQAIDREPPVYEFLLGRLLNDRTASGFLAGNNCIPAGPFQVCESAGLAVWTTHRRIIQEIYLYIDNTGCYSPYTDELPFGLTSNDTRADVEQKLGQPKLPHMPQWGWEPGLPDTGGTPDYIHYWAIYKRFNLTIVYNSPSASDRGATIHSIILNFAPASPPHSHTDHC